MEIHRSLKDSKHFRLFGASSVDDHARFIFNNYTGGAPYVTDADFIPWMRDFVAKHEIQFIFPAHDDVIIPLLSNDIGATVLAPPLETCAVIQSKRETYRQMPAYAPGPGEHFPMFGKPEIGNGGRGTMLINNYKDLGEARLKNLVITEYLPGPEYTVDCFTDRHGVLRFCEGRSRDRIKGGIAVETERVTNPCFREIADAISVRFKMRGAWFFQLKEDKDGELKLLEIAPRIAGSSGLWRAHGVNLAELTLWDAIDWDVEILFQDFPAQMSRALESRYKLGVNFDRVYIDHDDTIFLHPGWNELAIKFLTKCKNEKIEVIILSRRLPELIPEVLKPLITKWFFCDRIPKSEHINPEGAIFIDDSFAERKEVHDALGIPVFGLDAIEALM